MEHSKAEEAFKKKAIERDQTLTHAVYFADFSVNDEHAVQEGISDGLLALNGRALAANMVLMSTVISQSAYFDEAEGCGHLCLTVVAQWMQREALERLQTQQRLMGQNGGGR